MFYTNYQDEGKDKLRKMGYGEESPELKAVRMYVFDVTQEEVSEANNLFSTSNYLYSRTRKGLDRESNSISIIPGTTIDLDNGYKLEVKSNSIVISFASSLYDVYAMKNANDLSFALDIFIRYANNQIGSLYFNSDVQKKVLTVLDKMGIDTSRNFTVNGSTFKYENGLVTKNDTYFGYTMLTDDIMKNVLERSIEKYANSFVYC